MDDSELLAATAGGDAVAFATFYRGHLATVVAFCRNATGSAVEELAAIARRREC